MKGEIITGVGLGFKILYILHTIKDKDKCI